MMHSLLLTTLALAALFLPTQALYFYIDGPQQKCFFEELPKDTLVVGESPSLTPPSPPHPLPLTNLLSSKATTKQNNTKKAPAPTSPTPQCQSP